MTQGGRLTVEIVGLEELGKKLRSPLFKKPLKRLLTDASNIGEKVARAKAPKDTSSLTRDIRAEVRSLSARVHAPRNLEYYRVMEEGRRPGKFPPLSAISAWATRKGIPQGAVYVIARAIARRGIKGRFFMRQGKVAVEKAMPGLLRRMGRAVGLKWQD